MPLVGQIRGRTLSTIQIIIWIQHIEKPNENGLKSHPLLHLVGSRLYLVIK